MLQCINIWRYICDYTNSIPRGTHNKRVISSNIPERKPNTRLRSVYELQSGFCSCIFRTAWLNIKFMWELRSKKLNLESSCFKDDAPRMGAGFRKVFPSVCQDLWSCALRTPLRIDERVPVLSHVLKIQSYSISSCLQRGKGRSKKWEGPPPTSQKSNKCNINTGLSQRCAKNLIEVINNLGLIRETFWNYFHIDKQILRSSK